MLCPQDGIFLGKMRASHDGFISGEDVFMLKVAMLMPLKASDPFLCIKKKMGRVFNLEADRGATRWGKSSPTNQKKLSS